MAKKTAESEDKGKKKGKCGSFVWLMSVSFLAVGLLLFCQFYFGDGLTDKTTFYPNTHINGIDVSGMTKREAEEVVSSKLLSEREEIDLTLTAGEQSWDIKGEEFELCGAFEEPIARVLAYGREGNAFQKKKIENKIKSEGLNVNISYNTLLGGIDERLDEIISQVEREGQTPKISFEPDKTPMFRVSDSIKEIKVDRVELQSLIDNALENDLKATIAIPFTEITPEIDGEQMLKAIALRSSFKTSYATSSADRKHNVKRALSCFNGMIVEPGQEVSFNATTGARTVENGYKTANIIVGGVYTAGAGGGVCQASTTLYNALLLSGIDVLEVSHHSLPASYVPLSFDAMVSEGFSDLVFKNNLDCPIYIKAYGDDTNAYVEVYGQALEEGEKYQTRVEFVKILPHSGDKIVPDSNGEYSNKVLYKGEYYRVKYPREGYESKGYLQHVKDGEVIEEKQIRHDFYQPQSGIVVEGTEILGAGMTIPPSDIKIIPAQKVTDSTTQHIRSRIEKANPSEFNP
ncbi:MAG: VanW family protein [Acetobacter sp.]|nr:VanW family protein [Acetobacter sp.]